MRTTVTLLLFCLITIEGFKFVNGANEISTNDTNIDGKTSNGTESGGPLRNSKLFADLHKAVEVYQPPDQVKFFLFTHLNPSEPQQLRPYDTESVKKSNFNSSHPTRFTIHGWLSSSKHEINTLIRDAYLSKGPHNIIVVDWVTKSINVYDATILHVPQIGQKVAAFIDFMADNNWLKPENVTVAGHSLGSHVAGVAGRSLKSGRLHSIIGLDPASLGFNYNTSKHRLRHSDAYYVESIQTNCGVSSYLEPIGKATFYVNGGMYQPGCGLDLIGTCSHNRVYHYLAEAIRSNGFPCIRCNTYQDALNMNCGKKFSETIRMGAPNNPNVASGIFFVPVHPFPPYSH